MSPGETEAVSPVAARWTWQRIARILMVLGALYFVYWIFSTASGSLVPFMFGVVLAYLLSPIVRRLRRFMPKIAAILLVYLVGFVLVIGVFMLIVPRVITEGNEFFESLPAWFEEDLRPEAEEWLRFYNEQTPANIKVMVDEQMTNALNALKANAADLASGVTNSLISAVTSVFRTLFFLLGFLIIPFWLFYVLKDQDKGKLALDRLLPDVIRGDFWAILGIIDRTFSSYIRGQLILGGIVALMSFTGLTILNLLGIEVRYTLLLSLVAGLTELIPVIGPILGAIPAIIVGFFDSPTTALWVLLLYTVVQQVENNFLVPRFIGEAVEIHPAVLMVLLVVAGAIWGLPGVILVAPVAAILRDVFLYVYRRLEIEEIEDRADRGAPPGEPEQQAIQEQQTRPELLTEEVWSTDGGTEERRERTGADQAGTGALGV